MEKIKSFSHELHEYTLMHNPEIKKLKLFILVENNLILLYDLCEYFKHVVSITGLSGLSDV